MNTSFLLTVFTVSVVPGALALADSARELWREITPRRTSHVLSEGASLGRRLWGFPGATIKCLLALPILSAVGLLVALAILRFVELNAALMKGAAIVVFVLFAYGLLLVRGMLHRLAVEVARSGRIRRSWKAGQEIDAVIGHLGLWETAVAMLFLIPGAVALLGGGLGIGMLLFSLVGLEGFWEVAVPALSIVTGVVLLWGVMLLPLQWAVPLMAEHDCGWLRALEASTRLFGLDVQRCVGLGLPSFLLSLTGVGLPVSAGILMEGLRDFGPIVPLLLKERTERQTRALLKEEGDVAARPKAVQKGYDLLERGRYLDAVNSFQMILMKQFGQPDALRGEALGMLAMGNAGSARERLERWQRLEPDNPEPAQLLKELKAGLWSEGGERYVKAQERCTQVIGKGLTNREVLTSRALEDIRRGGE